MIALTKKRNPNLKIFSSGTISKSKNRSNEKSTDALNLQVKPAKKKAGVVNLKLNKNWMQDWMEQLNFLRINLTVLSLLANDTDDFCYYEDTSVTAYVK